MMVDLAEKVYQLFEAHRVAATFVRSSRGKLWRTGGATVHFLDAVQLRNRLLLCPLAIQVTHELDIRFSQIRKHLSSWGLKPACVLLRLESIYTTREMLVRFALFSTMTVVLGPGVQTYLSSFSHGFVDSLFQYKSQASESEAWNCVYVADFIHSTVILRLLLSTICTK